MLDFQYGVLQPAIAFFTGKPVAVFKNPYWVMPTVAVLTIWWTNGFNVLLFIAGLRNVPAELYEAAALDGATPWQRFWRVTWPLLWPVTALVLTLQLILQLKLFDQIYLTTQGGPFNTSYVLLLMMYREAFQLNEGGYGAAVAVVLVVAIAVISVLQFQILRAGARR
jgi:multiple sugar transport system permease protein